MTTTPMTYAVNVSGDTITVVHQPHSGQWLSPAHGETFGAPDDAMRAELSAYMRSCGHDPDDAAVTNEIEGYVAEMTAA